MVLDYVYLRDVGATYRMVQITQLEFMKQDGRRFRRKLSQRPKERVLMVREWSAV